MSDCLLVVDLQNDFMPGGALAVPGGDEVVTVANRIGARGGVPGSHRETPTGLAGYLRERALRKLYLCGLARDYCVAWSAADARAAGFEVEIIEEGCRAISP